MAEKKYVAAIDQGTTGTRIINFKKDSSVAALRYEEHEQIYPRPGWVEHDPLEIWKKTQRVTREALKEARIDPKEIAGVGVTNQRETTVVWSPKTGKPYYNAIVWQCTRTMPACQELKDRGLEPTITKKTGLYAYTYFSGPKIKWILDNVPGVMEKARRGEAIFGTVDTWVIWNITGGPNGGVHVTDYTNASRTMLMNLRTLDWDDEILEELDIPREVLPEIKPSSDKDFYGYTLKDGPFGAEIPVCGDLGDQQGALVGQVCFEPGEAKNTYGTGCFMLINTGNDAIPSKHGLLTTCAYGFEEGKSVYALEGSIAITGAAIQWLRDNLKIIKSAPETEEIAKSVAEEGSGGMYFVPAFSGLFAPYWDMYARGCMVGITRFVRREHIVHATLESICYQTRDVLESMVADSDINLGVLKVDGGAAANNYLMQLQANVIGVNVVRPTIIETSSLGAAYAAGLAVGFWENLSDLRKNWKVNKVFKPRWPEEKRQRQYKGWKKAVERARRWIDPEQE